MIALGPAVTERSHDGSICVEARQKKYHRYETLVVCINNRVFRFPDERVSDIGANGRVYFYNDAALADPKDEVLIYPHEFFMSPDKKWLFVQRGLFSHVEVAYVFHKIGNHFAVVHPRGMRFDQAALAYFGRRLHSPMPTISSGCCVIHLYYWVPNGKGFVFTVAEDTYYEWNPKMKVITAFYNSHSHRLKILKVE